MTDAIRYAVPPSTLAPPAQSSSNDAAAQSNADVARRTTDSARTMQLIQYGMTAGIGFSALQSARVVTKFPQMWRMRELDTIPSYLTRISVDRNLLNPNIPVGGRIDGTAIVSRSGGVLGSVRYPSTDVTRQLGQMFDRAATRIPTTAAVRDGMSFTRADSAMLAATSWFAPVMAAYQIGTGAYMIRPFLSGKRDLDDLATTRDGRGATLQTVGGMFGTGVVVTSIIQARHAAGTLAAVRANDQAYLRNLGGAGPRAALARAAARSGVRPFAARVTASNGTRIALSPLQTKIGVGFAIATILNQYGYLDVLNRGDRRPLATKLHQATQSTPILSNEQHRDIALGTVGVLMGGAAVSTASRLARQSGTSLSKLGVAGVARTIPRMEYVKAAVPLALLGASLAGALNWANSPAK